MNAETKPVDVLAVLDEAANPQFSTTSKARRVQLVEARAAVAELIEVATNTKNALAIIAGSEESDTSDKWYQLLFDDLPNLRAALARIGGAAP